MQDWDFVTSRLKTKGLFDFAKQMAEEIADLLEYYY